MPKRQRAFTLTELMVAVLIMVIVIIATSKIFGTVGRVVGVGEAGATIIQESAAIERQIRSDFERLSREGVFMIRCVAVSNDINVLSGGPLLNPALDPDDYIRADQIFFFAQGVQSIQTFLAGAGTSHKGQSAVSRVYYGHGFQLPAGPPVDLDSLPNVVAFDAEANTGMPVVPWSRREHPLVSTIFEADPTPSAPQPSNVGVISVTQPPATKWLLARQAVILASDDTNPNSFLYVAGEGNRSAPDIFHHVIVNGRVDAAAFELDAMRRWVLDEDDWMDQRGIISDALFYPRVERKAPSMHRVDQALTNNVLALACSSFAVDWTWTDGVGRDEDPPGVIEHWGVRQLPRRQLAWFGLDPSVPPVVTSFARYQELNNFDAGTIDKEVIEPVTFTQATQDIGGSGIVVYEAIFGFNQDMSLDPATGSPWDLTTGSAVYTPWPTSIRITMTLHDADLRLESGREVQFVINLP